MSNIQRDKGKIRDEIKEEFGKIVPDIKIKDKNKRLKPVRNIHDILDDDEEQGAAFDIFGEECF